MTTHNERMDQIWESHTVAQDDEGKLLIDDGKALVKDLIREIAEEHGDAASLKS